MGSEAFPEKVAIDSLGGNCSLASSDDHLAIRRRHTPCGVKPSHGGLHFEVHHNLPIGIHFSAKMFGQVIEVNVTSGGKKGLKRKVAPVLELQGKNLAAFSAVA